LRRPALSRRKLGSGSRPRLARQQGLAPPASSARQSTETARQSFCRIRRILIDLAGAAWCRPAVEWSIRFVKK
jgi:hypothetical protein